MAGSIPESTTGEAPSRVSPRAADVPAPVTTRATVAAWRAAARFVQRKPLGAISAVIVCGLVAVAVLAPVLAPYDPYVFNLDDRGLPIRMHPPSLAFLLGMTVLLFFVIYNHYDQIAATVGQATSASGLG